MIRFGTDGVRGRAGEFPIDAAGAARVGLAALCWARSFGDARVLIARDTRPSGEALAAAAGEAIVAAGGEWHDAGVLSSPGLAAAVEAGLAGVGIMVTASHNAAPDNGFKLVGPTGHKPDDAATAKLEAWMATDVPHVPGGHRVDQIGTARDAYAVAFLAALGDVELLEGKRIGVDLAHGAATANPAWLRRALPGVRFVWRATGDGVINDRVGSQHPEGLADWVRAEGLDAGIAVDGDADRCVLVDETGALVDGDALAWCLARGLGVQGMAVTVMSTLALEASLEGVRIVRTPVGDRHLMMAIREHGLELGAETSGHVLFGGGLPGGDGLITGLRACACAWASGATLSEAVAAFEPFPRVLRALRVDSRPPLDHVADLNAAVARGEAQLGPHGRVYLRYSGTEPVLRVLVEGPEASTVESVADAVCAVAQAALV